MEYHKSVLLNESVEALNLKPDGVYVDLTYGGGGHSRFILNQLGDKGRLYAFDQDENAFQNIIDDTRLMLIHQNFEYAFDYLKALGVEEVDGVLADLGVSSFQLNDDASGFSYRSHIDLDMRMDKSMPKTAKDILNSYSEEALQDIFQKYGEVRNAKTLAQKIVEVRQGKKFQYSDDLNEVLRGIQFGTFETYAAPIYQSIRMEVNQELQVLEKMLESIVNIIKIGGRLSVITFHSLEDRTVKNFMKYGEFNDEPTTDIFGRRKAWNWKLVNKKPIGPTDEEVKENSRSRSAKLRVIEKIG
ncbi:MAG: 16S rRNA (cytosine(1402)-N(4))-methyltransferase RsmH [Chitinophagales bacterium]|nr:16S rRNA (cytosine(1402)-N(4))-methyltransferase RsmH [Chitinophagales bacterium]